MDHVPAIEVKNFMWILCLSVLHHCGLDQKKGVWSIKNWCQLVQKVQFCVTMPVKRQNVRLSLGTDLYPHMPIYVHTSHDFTNGAFLAWRLHRHISTLMFTSWWAWSACWPICPILGFWGRKVSQNVRRLLSCSALTLVVGWQERHPAHKSCHSFPRTLFQNM